MPKIILNRKQLDHLLSVYQNEGPAAARKLAPTYGISKVYVKKLAHKHGVRAKLRGRKFIMPKRLPDFADPRWARARAIGVVIA